MGQLEHNNINFNRVKFSNVDIIYLSIQYYYSVEIDSETRGKENVILMLMWYFRDIYILIIYRRK